MFEPAALFTLFMMVIVPFALILILLCGVFFVVYVPYFMYHTIKFIRERFRTADDVEK